eukprot:TRINITY_DN47398_c0_g1_i1.p1 TRINITY_DN47398_c0_g1~~TRINITY_DN47398_c0_g1_i1.p1  ORF type:complete len:878 (-),score=314.20 TRINITY_DN47398_c0_g1_i1:207-2777(-)
MAPTADERAQELKVANVVRRTIQKVRLARPESLKALEDELALSLKEQLDGLGSLAEIVKKECDKGLSLGRTRAQKIEEQRKKEGVDVEAAEAAVEELRAALQPLAAGTQKLKEAMKVSEAEAEADSAAAVDAAAATLSEADAKALVELVKEHETAAKQITAECMAAMTKNQKMMTNHTLPRETKASWDSLKKDVISAGSAALAAIKTAKTVTSTVEAREEENKCDEMKFELMGKLKEALGKVNAAEEAVKAAEKAVEPLTKSAKGTDEEMKKVIEETEKKVEEVGTSISEARQALCPLDSYPDLSAGVKAKLAAFLAPEVKKPETRLGQFEQRAQRAANFVSKYHEERRQAQEAAELEEKDKKFDELKMSIFEKIKEAMGGVTAAEEAVKSAEKTVDPFTKSSNKPSDEELATLADEADKTIDEAKASIAKAREGLQEPAKAFADEDEYINGKVEALCTAEKKKPEIRLGQLEQRLQRATNFVKRYRDEVRRAKNSEIVLELKMQVLKQVKDAASSIDDVEASVRAAESAAEETLKATEEAGAKPLGETASSKAEAALKSVTDVRDKLHHLDDGLDEEVQQEMRAFIQTEGKNAEARLEQLETRVMKASSQVAEHLDSFRRARNAALLEELKPKALARVKQVIDNLPAVEAGVSEAEEAAARFGRVAFLGYTLQQMDSLAEKAKGLVDVAQILVDDARADVSPVEESLDADLKQEVLAHVAAESKNPRKVLERLLRRIERVRQLLKQFRGDIGKRRDTGYVPKKQGTQAVAASLVGKRMEVVTKTPMQDKLNISGAKVVRTLAAGEIVEVVEGPKQDDEIGVARVRVKASDGADGWATIAGNKGSIFLRVSSRQGS